MKKVKVEIGNVTLHLSAFCYQKVGNTENMKFRVESTIPEYQGEFDDKQSVKELFSKILEDKALDVILED